jgi:hypothetical protein
VKWRVKVGLIAVVCLPSGGTLTLGGSRRHLRGYTKTSYEVYKIKEIYTILGRTLNNQDHIRLATGQQDVRTFN